MKKQKKVRSTAEKKALNLKVAEIIYYVIGGIISTIGLVMSILGLIISSMDGRFEVHPLYPLYQFQTSFFKFFNMKSNFSTCGFYIMLIGLVYFLITIGYFASRQDDIDKRAKQRKLREKKLKDIIASSSLNDEPKTVETPTAEAK